MNDPIDDPIEPDELSELARRLDAERVLGALADVHAMAPPDRLRADLLRRAASAPRRPVDAAAPVALYRARAEALHDLLDDLGAEDWTRPTAPYRWTVHGLIAHLLVIERYTATVLGVTVEGGEETLAEADGGTGHLDVGADVIARELAADPRATAQRWWATVAAILDHVERDDYDADHPAPLHGWPFSADAALVARSFEIWTHADDVRRATGRPLDVLPPGDLRTMSSLSVGSLPLVVPIVSPTSELPPVRIVLTGDGGGVYDLGRSDPSDDGLLVSLDVVEYCRLAARRRAPDEIEILVEGSVDGSTHRAPDVVSTMWAAARAFAV